MTQKTKVVYPIGTMVLGNNKFEISKVSFKDAETVFSDKINTKIWRIGGKVYLKHD